VRVHVAQVVEDEEQDLPRRASEDGGRVTGHAASTATLTAISRSPSGLMET
jgi:hypothetical protein